tara:strand:+ start:755 stop:979 length:225 start_codon:yes stop_codon:yes gene_type:complete
MTKIIDKYLFWLSALTLPLCIVKLLGITGLTWWGVFTPLLILVTWCVYSVIAAGIAGGMDAVKEHKQRTNGNNT